MPVLLGWLGEMLVSYAGSILIRALVGAAIGFVSFKFGVGPAKTMIINALGAGGSEFVAYAGWMGIDKAVTIVLSAIAAKLAVKSMQGVMVKKGAAK